MKYKKLNYLVFFIYLISSSGSYSIERPDIDNLIIHKEKKTIGKKTTNSIQCFEM